MFLCFICGTQKHNLYKPHICPRCKSYLKYIEAPAKELAQTMYNAGLRLTYAVADVYTLPDCPAVHTAHICIGLACDYTPDSLYGLPDGFRFERPEQYSLKSLIAMERTIIADIISPIRTCCVLRYDTEYIDESEARAMLRQKFTDLKKWVEETLDDGWRVFAKLVGWLD